MSSHTYEEKDASYANTCNDVTLFSGTKGFFKNLAGGVLAMADNDFLKRLEKVEEGKKVSAVQENVEIMEGLQEVLSRVEPMRRGKCARVSSERRLAAAKALQEGDLTKAMSLASQAVFKAPMTGADEVIDGGVSLALALWLRSEVLLRCNLPCAALEDLKIALKERLPAKMRAKYYWRMGHCYRGAGEATRAKVSYELAERLLGKDEESKAQLQQDIKTLDFSTSPVQPPKKKGVTLTGGAKQNMPSLSKMVNINEEEGKGRFAVANSVIKPGDVLLVDTPYAACLLSDYYGTHCTHCFKRLQDLQEFAPIWCPKCSAVAFCSVQCRDAALSTYHTYECPFLDVFIGSGMSILSHIALRMVTQAGLDTCLSIYANHFSNEVKSVEGTILNDVEGISKKTKMKTRKERLNRAKRGLKNFAEKNLTDEEIETKPDDKISFEEKLELKSAQIYSLCTHAEHRKGEDHLKRIVMAMFLTECLKKAEFFSKCDPDNLNKAHLSICEIILRNLQLLQFNAHEIYETIKGTHTFSGSKLVYIAVGIYPTGALFNHECYPAVARYFNGRDIVLRATRPLSPGDVISENYGPHFMSRNLKERQRSLSCRYLFQCQCIACQEDWPTLKQLKDGQVYLRCPNISCSWKFKPISQHIAQGHCTRCNTKLDKKLVELSVETVERCMVEYERGAKLMDSEEIDEATETLCAAVDMFHDVACPPHKQTHLAQEALRSCFAARGNIHIITSDLDSKIPSVQNGSSP